MDMRDYELMYIVRPTVTEDQLPAATGRVDTMVGNLGGEVVENVPWGKRRLAYPIQNHEEGYYIISNIKLDPTKTNELEGQLRIVDDVIRHILVRNDPKPVPAPPAQLAEPVEPDQPEQPEQP